MKESAVDWFDVEMELSEGGREHLAEWVHDNAPDCKALADSPTAGDITKALRIAAVALEIADDWGLPSVQVFPPKEWGLRCYDEDEHDGWCSTMDLSKKLRQMADDHEP